MNAIFAKDPKWGGNLKRTIAKKKPEFDLSTTKGRLQATRKRKNVHENFVDLNPVWTKERHNRAVKVAGRYMSVVGDKIRTAVESERRRIFNE